jgi:hypothetical protein
MLMSGFLAHFRGDHPIVFQGNYLEEFCLSKMPADGFTIIGWNCYLYIH